MARLTLMHEPKLNAISRGVIAGLIDVADRLAKDEDLRVVVLTGDGRRAFSAGADLRVLRALTPETARTFITSLHQAIGAVRRLPVPVIAVLRGHCYGAGMELAAACDLRIADTSLSAGMPEVQVGIPSVIEASLLPRLIGWGRTAELLLTGRLIEAEEAMQIGFVERLSAPEDLNDALDNWIAMLTKAGPRAVRSQKAVMKGWQQDHITGLAASIDAFADAYRTDEPKRMLAGRT